MGDATIGIDLGGTKIYGVCLEGNDVTAEDKTKTPTLGGPLAVVDAIVEVVERLGGTQRTIGVGAPGVITDGVVKAAPNLPGWMEPFDLGAALSETLGGGRVVVDNDVNVGTLAELELGAGRDADELLAVFVGTGVGGGLVFDRQIRRGPTGLAGEIGHVVVRPDGRPCGCGSLGHLEAYAGRAGLERRARELDAGGRDTVLVELSKAKRMTSGVWAKALAKGDEVAIELLDEAVEALGIAIANVVTVLDLRLVVVGGGLADRLGPAFVGRIEQAVRSRVFAGSSVRVVSSELGDRSGAVGAALLARSTG